MRTTTKKTQTYNETDKNFSDLLDESKPTILFSDTLRETVDHLLQTPAERDVFKCKIRLEQEGIICNLICVDTCAQATTIKAEVDRGDAWVVLNSLDSLTSIEIEKNKNMLDSHVIERIKLSKKKSTDKFLLKVKLLKS